MTLVAGRKLGPYEILAPLGAGGMGEVYKARDTRIDRTVAIKVLPAPLAADPHFRERFDREAHAIAALSHPHICALYDIGHQDGTDFLVMEYLDGETLAQRLTKGALPLAQVLCHAIEIADALDKAHRAGIVHRDVKPGNVMLTKAGAKLLDFGLAKAAGPVVAAGGASLVPTVAPLTAQGTLLGTLQYMAPEQLEGKEADARTDIFAFGAVLYEMVTGKKAFEGKSQASLIAAILEHDPPPIAATQPLTPPALDRLVKKCLAKDRDDRWQSAKDLCDELRWITEAPSSAIVRANDRQAASLVTRERVAWFLMTCLVAALVAFALRRPASDGRASGPTDSPTYRSSILPPDGASFLDEGYAGRRFALSPDGRRLVFMVVGADGRMLLWVRSLDALTAQPLAGTENAAYPFWSADSRSVAFFSGYTLKRVDVASGSVFTIGAVTATGMGTWNADGIVLVGSTVSGTPISRVAASGGALEPVTTIDATAGETSHYRPVFLPDGRHFLYVAGSSGGRALYVASLDGREKRLLLRDGLHAAYAQGSLLFLKGATLMAQPFDVSRLMLTGDAVPIAEGIALSATPTGEFSVSAAGVLAYQSGTGISSRLMWFDRTGKPLGVVGEPGDYNTVSLSPDGSRAAVSLATNGNRDIWLVDVAQGSRTRFTFDPGGETAAVWSPDGLTVVFDSQRTSASRDLFQKASNGSGSEELIDGSANDKYPLSWSANGRFLLYGTRYTDLWVLPLFGDRKPRAFLQTPFAETRGQFAPDGRWMAYRSNESGRTEVYVTPFPGPGGKWQVSTAGGNVPRWRRDGAEIFYIAPDGQIMSAAVNGRGSAFEVGTVRPLFNPHILIRDNVGMPYDVSPDGQRFLVNTAAEQAAIPPITLIVNWLGLLTK